MNTITIRVDDTLFAQIENKRGTESKSKFYRHIIEQFLNTPEPDKSQNEYILSLGKEIESLKSELTVKTEYIRVSDERIKDLQNQLGFLQLEFQKLTDRLPKLLPAAKRWWEIWK